MNEDQFIFINSKQVDRILKRREQRKKLNYISRFYKDERVSLISNFSQNIYMNLDINMHVIEKEIKAEDF